MNVAANASKKIDAVAVWGLPAFEQHLCAVEMAACGGYGPAARGAEYRAGACRQERYGDPVFGKLCVLVSKPRDPRWGKFFGSVDHAPVVS